MAENRQTYQKAMSRGNSAAWDLDWASAAEFYQQALDEFPENPMALVSMGLALYEQKKYDQALVYYKKAAVANPEDPASPEKIADIFERQGRLKEAVQSIIHAAELHLKAHDAQKAISCYEQAISLDPANLHAHTRLALIFERMQKKDRAVQEYLAAASVLQRSGNLARAAQTVDHCIAIDPENPDVIAARDCLKNRQMLPEPRRPKNVSASLRMAEVMEPKKDPTTKQLIRTDDTLPVDYFRQKSLVVLASFLFESPASITFTNNKSHSLSESQRNDVSVLLNKAVDAMTHQQDREAVDAMEALVRIGVNEGAIFYNLGCLLIDTQPRKAVEYLEHCVRRDDYALGAFLLLGRFFYQRGGLSNLRRAATFYIRALGIADLYTVDTTKHAALREAYTPILDTPQQLQDEKELKSLCETIETQVNRKDWMRYLSKIRTQLPETDPKNPAPLSDLMLKTSNGQVLEAIAYIQGLVAKQKYDSAMEEAFYALNFAPSYLPLQIELARLLALRDEVPLAVQKYRLISRLYLLRGEHRQGARMLEEALALAPSDYALRTTLIELLIDQERLEDALGQYLKLAETYEIFANFDQMRKVLFDALRLASRMDRSRDWSLRILNMIADIDMKRLDWHRAQRVYEQIRTLAPDDPSVRQQLIGVHYRLGQDQSAEHEIDDFITTVRNTRQLESGVEFLNGLIETWPHKYFLRVKLSEIYGRLNRKEEALDQLNIVASAYLDEGDTPKTVEVLQRMMTIDPEHAGEYQLVIDRVRKQGKLDG
ncbi:MAG: tetratricopeptide repeat protein [Anaerolineae bacterium]|nr:tetratricopeptide repeat protein [Anaerolineae bacterium]